MRFSQLRSSPSSSEGARVRERFQDLEPRTENPLGPGMVWVYDPDYYPTSPATDPLGPGPTVYRSYRGGAWYAPAEYTRVARRNHDHPDRFNFGLGLRLARTVP